MLSRQTGSAENELLLCCARAHLDGEMLDRIKILLGRRLDWEYLIDTSLTHGVMPLLYSSLQKSFPQAVPKASLDRLKNHFRGNVQRSFSLAAELRKLVELFDSHSIRAIPFKGPVLAASVYGDLSLRQFGDLDILVNKQNILSVGELLVSQGYKRGGGGGDGMDHDDHDDDHDDVAYLGPNYYVFTQPESGVRIDLQWRITERYFSFSLDNERLWKRLAPVSIGGKSILTFAPMDLLLILCVHGSKHCWEKLKWVCDVAELVRSHGQQIDWIKIQQEASSMGVGRMLGLGLFLAHELLGARLPGEVAKRVESDRRMQSVARQIREKLFAPSDKPTGDFQRVVFYLKVKNRWQDRWRFCSRYVSQFVHKAITPNSKDRAGLPLPAPFFFLHYFFRPLRLMVEYGRLGLARISKRGGSARGS
jgi:hypothetical protein